MKIELKTLEDTELFGAELWKALPSNCLVFLQGQLGAGKTTLVRGILTAAGHKGAVKSPTYTLVEEYDIHAQKIFHFDLYRVADPEELELIGIRDYMDQTSICFVEWPELGADFLPEPDLIIALSLFSEDRILKIENKSKKTIKLRWKNKDILL
ncbi:MAG: tRNA (adenosine(37)-N6)-threonylcarbamoyltransferase complex ATPase subunit type 1 TsaE [Methylococcaceae bacterium]|nr:tRNA (adenosine(37)-N6)-threonylcarbamoyltransferase complex ATPase subunit type 1 TsaE [Methylococcaceae bacterium]